MTATTKWLGKSENMNTKTNKQIEVIERRFIKRFSKNFGWYDIEITQNEDSLYQFSYQLGINYIISGGELIGAQETLLDMFEHEIISIQDCLDWELQQDELDKDMIRTLKSLVTFHKNIVKYLEQSNKELDSLEFGTVIESITGSYIFAKKEGNILLCWDYDERHNLYNIELDTIIKITKEKITNVGRIL